MTRQDCSPRLSTPLGPEGASGVDDLRETCHYVDVHHLVRVGQGRPWADRPA